MTVSRRPTLDYPTLNEAKSETVPHVNALLNVFDILEQTEPDVHTALIDKLDLITTAVMSTARARKTRNAGEDELVAN